MDSVITMHDFGLGILIGVAGGVLFDRFLLIPVVAAWTRAVRRHGGRAH